MKKIFITFSALLLVHVSLLAQLEVTNLLCENKINPLGLSITQPRFCWVIESSQRNVMQSAYEVRVARDSASLKNGNSIWTSGKTLSSQSVYVSYAGVPLQSGLKYYWQVRVWDNANNVSG